MMNSATCSDRATQYAVDVIAGVIKAGKLVKLACKRHLEDLQRQDEEDFPWIWDVDRANHILRFGEKLKFFDGLRAGEYITLVPFQCFVLGSLYGWVHRDTGFRRFNKSFIMLARKNAKSLINAIIGLYTLEFLGKRNLQLYCIATKSDQAKIVWEQIKNFAEGNKALNKRFRHYAREGITRSLKYNNIMRALGRDTRSIDGFLPYLGICDEVHAYRDNQPIKLLQDGTINLPESLISMITTAGFDVSPTNPAVIEYDYSKAILNRTLTNERYFCFVAQMDDGDDYFDPANWEKCSPLLPHIPGAMDNMQGFVTEAADKGGQELANLYTKTFNVFYEYDEDKYLTLEEIRQNACELTLEDMRDKECTVGIDLAAVDDMTAVALEFDTEDGHFTHSHAFVPDETMNARMQNNNVPYNVWIKQGLVTTTPGIKTDYSFVVSYLREIQAKYNLKFGGIGYDRHGIESILYELDTFGCPVVDIIQSAKSLDGATLDVQINSKSGKQKYNKDNQLYEFCFSNAVLDYNSFGECKIDKRKQKNKIDVADAVINAHKMHMVTAPTVDVNNIMDAFNALYGKL